MNTITKTNQQTIFVNIFKAIKAENAKELQRFISDLNEKTDVGEILNVWYYKGLLPKGKQSFVWELEALKSYLIERKVKRADKEVLKKLTHLQTVEQAADLIRITVSIEWKKSRMWGNNPNASARVATSDNYESYVSGSIGGCGYDKESTAVAQSVNQSNSFLKAMYLVKEKHPKTENRELFGYGSGYGVLPQLEGGVGVSCYPQIFKKIGFKWSNTESGKTFDVYTATKETD